MDTQLTAPAFRLAGTREPVAFRPRQLVVAGYTGRDGDKVRHHIDELAAIGVPPPATVPAYYVLPVDLVTTADRIVVGGPRTSGEVEPVLLCGEDGWYLGVGSDHTDRDLEREDVAASKGACPKVVGSEVVAYADVERAWDDIAIRSRVGAEGRLYQEGRLAELLPPRDILAGLETAVGTSGEDAVVFLGTVPLRTESFVFSDRYTLELVVPGDGPTLSFTYEVAQRRP